MTDLNHDMAPDVQMQRRLEQAEARAAHLAETLRLAKETITQLTAERDRALKHLRHARAEGMRKAAFEFDDDMTISQARSAILIHAAEIEENTNG